MSIQIMEKIVITEKTEKTVIQIMEKTVIT